VLSLSSAFIDFFLWVPVAASDKGSGRGGGSGYRACGRSPPPRNSATPWRCSPGGTDRTLALRNVDSQHRRSLAQSCAERSTWYSVGPSRLPTMMRTSASFSSDHVDADLQHQSPVFFDEPPAFVPTGGCDVVAREMHGVIRDDHFPLRGGRLQSSSGYGPSSSREIQLTRRRRAVVYIGPAVGIEARGPMARTCWRGTTVRGRLDHRAVVGRRRAGKTRPRRIAVLTGQRIAVGTTRARCSRYRSLWSRWARWASGGGLEVPSACAGRSWSSTESHGAPILPAIPRTRSANLRVEILPR